MKKVSYLIFAILLLVGCGADKKEDLSMEAYENAFKDAGLEIEEEKPLFGMIGAKDGFILYRDGNKVAVYEFDSQKDIKTAEEALPAAKDWDRQGLILLETSDEEAKKIFKNVK